jgi:hypothetical protein
LRAFSAMLKTQTGEAYGPQYMTAPAYQAILGGTADDGNGPGAGQGNSQAGSQRGGGYITQYISTLT